MYLWARQSEVASGLEEQLRTAVRRWLQRRWPFENVVFPGTDLDWEAWSAVAESPRPLAAPPSPTEAVTIAEGTGSFTVTTRSESSSSPIEVHYYKARGTTAETPIVIVMPGGGRNGDDYRDSWIEAAEQFDLLVLSPSFSEAFYPGPLHDNMARMATGGNLSTFEGTVVQGQPSEWIFGDLDHIFELAKAATGSKRTGFDFFGHSAGGQIGHRLAIFYPQSKADTIVAANAGWYTTASPHQPFPYGGTCRRGAPLRSGRPGALAAPGAVRSSSACWRHASAAI